MVTKITHSFNSRKFKLAMIRIGIIACTIAMAMCNVMIAFADDETGGGGGVNENTQPTGIGGTTTMNTMITIGFWVLRGIIIIIAAPGLMKAVQGQADENPRDRNAGIATVAIAGLAFAGTFAVRALI